MRRVRAYSREERKRLIIHVFAEAIRKGEGHMKACAEIANKMDIVPSTKLRAILRELVADEILLVTRVEDEGIAGFRDLYELNYHKASFEPSHPNRRSAKMARTIKATINGKVEALQLS
jgi:hypothetical protein